MYPEISFVLSGFQAVANHLNKKFGLSVSETMDFMKKDLAENGRGRTFRNLLHAFDCRAIKEDDLVTTYRSHEPQIELPIESKSALRKTEELFGRKPFLITDGHHLVQKRKVEALKLDDFLAGKVFTDDFGKPKPDPFSFLRVAAITQTNPSGLVYIGDDPTKDFQAVNLLGGITVRVRQGRLKSLEPTGNLAPTFEVTSLPQVVQILEELAQESS